VTRPSRTRLHWDKQRPARVAAIELRTRQYCSVKSRIWREWRRKVWHTVRWFFADTVPKVGFEIFDRVVSFLVYSHGPARDGETVGPVVLLLPSKRVRLVRWRVLDWLTLDSSASSRMHGGLVVTRTTQIVEVSQSSYVNGEGRRVKSSHRGVQRGLEYKGLMSAIASIEAAPGYSLPTLRDLVWSPFEVLVFSSVPTSIWSRMKGSRFLRRRLALLGAFDSTDTYCRRYLWDHLPLYAAVGSGIWFEMLQDSPGFGWPPSEDETFRVDPNYFREPRRSVLFADFGRELYFERGARTSAFPRGLPPIEEEGESPRDPSSQALHLLGREPTTRISPQDNPSAGTHFVLAQIGLRYPDPMLQLDKIMRYCLDLSHVERKWVGFASAGYEARRADDPYLLAASLSSALLFEPMFDDLRTTADGGLQFGANVALPTRAGGFASSTTSWLLTSTGSPRLSTASISGTAGRRELAGTITIPGEVGGDFAAIADWVEEESEKYAATRYSDGGSAFGRLWIRHDHTTSAAFARWLRRSSRGDSVIYTRRAFGGQVTQWFLNAEDGASTEARLAFAQVALLALGIRSHRELRWD
jgi:hypothetical protein